MDLPQAKHDALFRLIAAGPRRADALVPDDLPPDIVAGLDPDSLHERQGAADFRGVRNPDPE